MELDEVVMLGNFWVMFLTIFFQVNISLTVKDLFDKSFGNLDHLEKDDTFFFLKQGVLLMETGSVVFSS